MLAWRYGNADNSFKILPKELVKHILSFDLGELEAEQPWFKLALELFKKEPFYQMMSCTSEKLICSMLPFAWYYWTEAGSMLKTHVVQSLCGLSFQDLPPQDLTVLLGWLVKYIDRLGTNYNFRSDFASSELFQFIMQNHDLKWIKHLLATGTLKKEWFTTKTVRSREQMAWRALRYLNEELIEFYIQQDMMPFTSRDMTLEMFLNEQSNAKREFVMSVLTKHNKKEQLDKARTAWNNRNSRNPIQQ